jgi:hypothetical protein
MFTWTWCWNPSEASWIHFITSSAICLWSI